MNLLEIHQDVIANFQGIVKEIELLPTKWDNQLKLKITFVDDTTLRVAEVFYQHKIIAYSYYHLNERNELIAGWDSAPHHKHLQNFPYHKHVGKDGKIQSSVRMDLNKALSAVQKKIISNT